MPVARRKTVARARQPASQERPGASQMGPLVAWIVSRAGRRCTRAYREECQGYESHVQMRGCRRPRPRAVRHRARLADLGFGWLQRSKHTAGLGRVEADVRKQVMLEPSQKMCNAGRVGSHVHII